MLNQFDKARIDGYTGTAAEFVFETYKAKGFDAAREMGYTGPEYELVEMVTHEEAQKAANAERLALRGDSAYQVAVSKGFDGDESAWLKSLMGSDGLNAYEIAVSKGFEGDESVWLQSLHGSDGSSAYELALHNGFDGTEKEWIDSLKALDGLSAYELAQSLGFSGTLEQFIESLRGPVGPSGKDGKDGKSIKGDKGDKGDMPAHQWDGTRLRFERPDGTWGQWVELKGLAQVASMGAGSLTIQQFADGTANFPVNGKAQVLYFDTSTDPYTMYVWDGATYVAVGGGGSSSGPAYTVAVAGKNTSGALIPKGTPVMATGTLGASGVITIAPMDGTNPDNYKYLIGVAGADIAIGATGDVVDTGKVRGFDTTTWDEGDVLWISTTEVGKFTNVEPTTGLKMPVAFVVTDHHTNGEIMVRVTPVDENAHVKQTFETVSKNLAASNATLNYNDGELSSVVYSNGITKTLAYSGGNITTVTLSGATPNGIDLVKTMSYDNGEVVGIAYS